MSKASSGTLYRGREGMWSWVGHRITGVVIFLFLLVHVLDTSLVRVAPGAYDAVMATYKNPLMALGETALVAAIVFALRPTGFLGIIGIVAVGVFYADVRPAVRQRSR